MYKSQTVVGGESCGACATSYILEELAGWYLNVAAIRGLWDDVKFRPAMPPDDEFIPGTGVLNSHTDPTKLVPQIEEHDLAAKAYIHPASPLAGLVGHLDDPASVTQREGLGLLKGMPRWRAIAIFRTAFTGGGGLHYVATRYVDGHYEIMDSNMTEPAYVTPVGGGLLPACPPLAPAVLTAANGLNTTYTYLNACLVVRKD